VPSVDCSTSPEPKLPGENASTVTVASLVNSLPRWLLKSKCSLSSFLHSIVAEPKDVDDRPTFRFGEADFSDRPLWPMAVPYPEVFTKKVDSDDAWLKKLISLQVVVLSWLHLGEPAAAPISLCLGSKLSAEQWSVVSMLRRLNRDGNTPIRVDASLMGRSAAKFEGIEKLLKALYDASTGLHAFGGGSDFYSADLSRPHDFEDSWLRCGEFEGFVSKDIPITAKPITASRLSFPQPPLSILYLTSMLEPLKFSYGLSIMPPNPKNTVVACQWSRSTHRRRRRSSCIESLRSLNGLEQPSRTSNVENLSLAFLQWVRVPWWIGSYWMLAHLTCLNLPELFGVEAWDQEAASPT